MTYHKHRHFWRLVRRWHNPDGYLFECRRCKTEHLYHNSFIRYNQFWRGTT